MKPLDQATKTELRNMEVNATRLLKTGTEKQQLEAREWLEKIGQEKEKRLQKKGLTGDFVWDDSDRGHRIGYYKSKKIAEIIKDENHNASNDEVYTVIIGGQLFQKRFRHIADARHAVEDGYLNSLKEK